ncbi:MAG: hypothetical protein GF393_05515 [Armatimonadia bacterium]|nr:hypothetical protein [Armatimonadia bacterium]
MKPRVICWLLVACLLAACQSTRALAQDAPVGVQDLASATGEEALEVARQIIAQREAMIAGLVEQMNEQEDWDRDWGGARYAAFLLGYMRAVEAAPILAQFIDFGHLFPHGDVRGHVWQGNLYQMPAAWALVQIGEPCLDDVINRVAEGGPAATGSAGSYCVLVLVELRGVEGARVLLSDAIAAEIDAERRKRLRLALSNLLQHSADYAKMRVDPGRRTQPLRRVP